MDKLEFTKCCFCVELRLGCLILGYLKLIASLTSLPLNIVGLLKLLKLNLGTLAVVEHVSRMVLYIAGIIFSIILLVGLYKYKRSFVKTYLIYELVDIILGIIVYMIKFKGVVEMLIDIGFSLFGVYLLLVVRSYYLKMPEGTAPATPAAPAAPAAAPAPR